MEPLPGPPAERSLALSIGVSSGLVRRSWRRCCASQRESAPRSFLGGGCGVSVSEMGVEGGCGEICAEELR